MSKFSSLKSLTEGDTLIYIAPAVLAMSLLHVFSASPITHKLGQIEVIMALGLVAFYIWQNIPSVYELPYQGKKKMELAVCCVVGVMTALLAYAPLLTWQIFGFYRASGNHPAYHKPLLTALLTLWIGTALFYAGSFSYSKARMQSAETISTESVMPNVMEGQH